MRRTFTKYFLCFLSYFVLCTAQAQTYPRKEIDIRQFIEDLFAVQDQDSDTNYEDLYEALYQLYQEPLNLNKATREDLIQLFILKEAQITNLLNHIKKTGKLLSIYELQSIEGFDLDTIYKILPFVTVESNENADARPLLNRILDEKNRYLIMRYQLQLQKEKGFTEQATPSTRYLGSRPRLYTRFRTSHSKDFSFGFTMEKDEGEQILWSPAKNYYGMDFFSYHAFLENKGRFKQIVLGDYQIQIGQSLLLAAGFNIGKGAETVQGVRRANTGIRPFTSLLEAGYLRGGAVTYNLMKNKAGELDVLAFASLTRRDGNIVTRDTTDDNDTGSELFISSVQRTGFHRTQREFDSRAAIQERTVGGNLSFKNQLQTLQIGTTFLHTSFSVPLQRTPTTYNQFEFNGKNNYNVGFNYSYVYQNYNFFGEWAMSKSGGMGYNAGLIASLSPQISFAMQYRNFDKNFHSFYGSALSEGSRDINEQGIYWGIKIQPNRKISLAAYYDKFRFPWLRFRVDAPSEGYEYLLRLSYAFTKKINVFGQVRQEVKGQNDPNATNPIDFVTERKRRNYVLNIDYKAEKWIGFRSRVQYSNLDFGGRFSEGYALMQDVDFNIGKWELRTRWALFDTDNFDNRQYAFEDDVLYSFSFPAYNGRGIRQYAVLEHKLSRKITLWFRYARTRLLNVNKIGSGSTEIQGNVTSDIRVQARIKF
jgi:hypothetical protein